ncbi:hypothetical protein M231_04362 [Tremella mesenterica]|uniref:ER membrane protein complex subunit 6 n=1 Tax=Tremella mesenterica TaxID=5217 RepID=A0A4Q1BKW3_TREME|nr:hypothetical protein M231_04362 [Tremella mesenterica]
MNPSSTASTLRFDPSASPLHPPSLCACFSGLTAGILGLTNYSGFLLYLITSLLSAIFISVLKCGLDPSKYVAQAHSPTGGIKPWKAWWGLTGLGQESLLGFLLFWIGGYGLIHVYD